MIEGTCIYCTKTRPLTKEHVMPKALGGNVTMPLVCEDCRFPELDLALAENTLLSMARVGFTQPGTFPVKLGGSTFKYDEKHDLDVEVAIRNRMTAVPLPQLHFRLQGDIVDSTLFVESEEARDAFVAFIDGRHARGALPNLHVTVGPTARCRRDTTSSRARRRACLC